MSHPSRRDALRTLLAGSVALAVDGGRSLGAQLPGAGEILIRGGRIVNADGSRDADVRILGSTIAEIGPGLRPGPGARVIDAAGRLVLPGGIDPHTHVQPPFAESLTTGTRAALAGGITTIGTFVNARSGESLPDALERMGREVSAEAVTDVILHTVARPPGPEAVAALPSLVRQGQPSLKVYMTAPDFHALVPAFLEMLEAARDAGVVTLVHCEDGALLAAAVRDLTAAGRTSLDYYGQSRPVVAEVAATRLVAALCEITGAPVHVVHLSSARALEACADARSLGLPLSVETRPMYLHLTEERLAGPDGPLYVGQPPLRTRADSEALWRGLADGTIDFLATDHAPWTRAQKLDPALTVSRVRPGSSDLQFVLPMYFSEGVGKRGLPLERFVATTSTNAARIFGLYPHRGVVREGSSADLAVWDPRLTRTVRAEADFSQSDYSPYEGWEVTGWPTLTLRRGEVVYEADRITAAPGSGRLVSRDPWRP